MSFRYKTIVGVALIEAIMLALLIWNALYILTDSNERELFKRAHTTTSLFASSNKDAILSYDLATLESFVQEVLKEPGIIYARILGQDKTVLAQAGDPAALARPFEVDLKYSDVTDNVYDSFAVIETEGVVYGRVEIGFSIDDITTIISDAKRKSLIFASIEMLLSGIFSLILGIYLTRAINHLRIGAENIMTGNLGYQIKIQGRDELAAAASAFNAMSSQLKQLDAARNQAENELKQLNDNLEALVRARTHELATTNRKIEKNRKKLKSALDGISDLIQNVTTQTDMSVRLANTTLGRCWETKNCHNKSCTCYGKEALRCWQEAGTFCGGEPQGDFVKKYQNCIECEVYQQATADPIFEIGEQFNNMMHVLDIQNSELENAYKELKSAQAQMLQREKMASVGQLAAGVAHEINNPVGFIASNLSTLSKYVDRLTEYINTQKNFINEESEELKELRKKLRVDFIAEDAKDLIKESLDGTDRVSKIVQGLKSFSRVDETEYKPSDINECLESTINIVWNELKYKATVNKDYGDLPLTKCYSQQLNQVFMNLLVNASHAIEKQGEINIKTWQQDNSIFVSISDTGSGIPKENLNKLFEPFFTTKEVGKGTGLGLSIAYDIVKKHGGDIWVDSEIGKGTTFTIQLPVVEG